jgi:hypothetical protein
MDKHNQKNVVVGTEANSDELAMYLRFREKFLPDTRIAACDAFAKWLFGLSTTVAALGAGFSNFSDNKVSICGKVVWGVSILLAAIGFFCAIGALHVDFDLDDSNSQSKKPGFPSSGLNIYSYNEIYKQALVMFDRKKTWVFWATGFLGGSLILAGVVPLVSCKPLSLNCQPSGVTYSYASGVLNIVLSNSKLKPYTGITMHVETESNEGKRIVVGTLHSIADLKGETHIQTPAYKVPDNTAKFFITSECGQEKCFPDVRVDIVPAKSKA